MSAARELEDWGAVWARVQEKARRMVGASPSTTPAAETPTMRERRLERNDRDLSALVGRFMARAATLPRDAAPDPAPVIRSPVAVRIGWYIPPRHQEDTLESYQPQTASQRIALDATRAWVDAVKRGEGGALALLGDVGTGKSHLMFAAIRAVNEAGIHAAAWGWYDLARLLREAKYNPDAEVQSEACRQRDRLFAAKAFGIDEIRPTSGTDFDVTELAQLMTRAYRECQGVIVTSNAVDRQLTEIIGRAASSRLTQVKITGPDLRKPENRHLKAI